MPPIINGSFGEFAFQATLPLNKSFLSILGYSLVERSNFRIEEDLLGALASFIDVSYYGTGVIGRFLLVVELISLG